MKLDQFQERRRTKEENVVSSPISSECEVGSVSKNSTKSEKMTKKRISKIFKFNLMKNEKYNFKKKISNDLFKMSLNQIKSSETFK